MKKKSAHDILTLLGDVNSMGGHEDKLSRLISDTIALANRQAEELSEDEMELIAAAYKPEEAEDMDLFRRDKRR